MSVEDKDSERAAKLRQSVTETVDSVLSANSSSASVLSQTVKMCIRDSAETVFPCNFIAFLIVFNLILNIFVESTEFAADLV